MLPYIIALICTLIAGIIIGHKVTVWIYNVMVHQGQALFTDSKGNWVGREDLVRILKNSEKENK